jgi:hypothetical protein
VALDEAHEAPLIVLKPIASAEAEPVQGVPYLVESRWRVHDVQAAATGVRFVAEGFGPGEFLWQWPGPADVIVRWRAGADSSDARVKTDASGRLSLQLPMLTNRRVDISVTAVEARDAAR